MTLPLLTTRLQALAAMAALTTLAGPARAEDRADLDRTQIIGNRELPKVLYIVPWKKPLPAEASVRPPVSVIDEALAPIDREVFRRGLQYERQLAARQAGETAATGADAGAATNAPAKTP